MESTTRGPQAPRGADRRRRGEPAPKPLSYLLVQLALLLVVAAAAYLAWVSVHVSDANQRLAGLRLAPPGFSEYLNKIQPEAALPTAEPADAKGGKDGKEAKPAAVPAPAPLPPGSTPRKLAERAIAQIAQFENTRAEPRLREIRPVIAGVTPGSTAQAAGIVPGDIVFAVDGRLVNSVWDVYASMIEHSDRRAEVDMRRGPHRYRVTLLVPEDQRVDASTSGMLFSLPAGVNLIGKSDLGRLTDQLFARFLDLIPADWRIVYAANLLTLTDGLGALAADQARRGPGDPGYIAVDRLLLWHHEAFLGELARYQGQVREIAQAQAEAQRALGEALTGLAATLVLTGLLLSVHLRHLQKTEDQR